MQWLNKLIIFSWLSLSGWPAQAATVDDVRGALLYNLSKVIIFPELQGDKLTLCVYPKSAGIIAFFQGKNTLQSQGKTFQLQILNKDQKPDAVACQMLYLEWPLAPMAEPSELTQWSSGILTISNDPEFLLQGGLLTLTTLQERMVITMNKNSLKQSNVSFPARVLKLAMWYP